jgi:predicted lipoprotein with Yx(FWY)xxD motif
MSLTAGSRAILAAAATLIVVAGCAGSGASGSPAASASSSPSAAGSPEASGQAAGPPEVYEVTVATDATYGAHLAGEDGKSLYIFGKDSANTSACSGTCTANWPPFLLGASDTVKAGAGVTGTLATFKRADGSTQVTINGLPLYYFANDSAAGAVNGQGIGGLWHLASPTGTPVGASPDPSAGYGY